jgi:RNA polymerase subunit RPABC4/transcription elongation factor Spt4
MAIISCKECSGKVSDTAATCPHCGAAVAVKPFLAPVAVAPKEKSTWWKWVLGVPVGLFILMMVIGSLNSNPEKTQDRRVYEQCLSDLAGADRARSSAGSAMAGMCERFRSDYVKKWNSNP